ncbi:MAG: hypothetical protein V7641_1576 [Blastocatellia bacterium]
MNREAGEIERPSDAARRDANAIAQSLSRLWQRLCKTYLPVAPEDSIWSFSRAIKASDPEQGWKLHVSANLLTACEVLERVAPFLQAREVLFKAPSTLQWLSQLNCGLDREYSQVGKFITVYPGSDEEAVFLARRLHKMTLGRSAPAVPFDLKFRPDSSVYYRYGGFKALEIINPDGTRTPAIRNQNGELISDLCKDGAARPVWISDPFINQQTRRKPKMIENPFSTNLLVLRALSQRGKGGVYQGIDLSDSKPRLCIIKEGRHGGEIGWDGRDGNWRVRNEEWVLRSLRVAGLNVPRTYSSFELERNYYLVTEFIEGDTLQRRLNKRKRRLSITQALRYGHEIARLISKIHAAGWAWRDCKPANLLVTTKGELRPVDFEGACPLDKPDPLPWNTPEFSPPEWQDACAPQSRIAEDIYAVGAVMHYLLTGRWLDASSRVRLSELRPNVPAFVCALVSDMVASDPQQRPSARCLTDKFKAALSLA